MLGTDEGLASQMGQLVMFRFNTSNTWIRQRWEVNYRGIHRANQVIANIDRVKTSTTAYTAYPRAHAHTSERDRHVQRCGRTEPGILRMEDGGWKMEK